MGDLDSYKDYINSLPINDLT